MPITAELDPLQEKRIVISGTSPLHKDLMNTIPGCSYNYKRGKWFMPLGWAGCLALRAVLRDQLVIGPDLAKWATDEVENRINPSMFLRTALDAEGNPALFSYQRAGVAFLATARRALCADEMGTGKSQPISEPVLTPDGFKPMGDIKQGDYVVGSDGQPTMVYGTYRQGVRSIYKITFKDGTYTYADGEHLWRVASPAHRMRGGWQTLTTKDLLDRGVNGYDKRTGNQTCKWAVPLAAPIEFTEHETTLPVDPYLLGVLLGDGDISKQTGVGFCSMDLDIIERAVSTLPAGVKHSIKHNVNFRNDTDVDLMSVSIFTEPRSAANPVLDSLRSLGVMGHRAETKFVPKQYLYASTQDRWALLQGLMDTDGSIDTRGLAGFGVSSKQLADDVAFLVRSLGGVARQWIKPRRDGGNFDMYCVSIKMPDNSLLFNVARKKTRAHEWKKYPPVKLIQSIAYSHDEEAQCIAVAASDHLYVTRDFIVTHNTRQALTALQQIYLQGTNPFPALIVCPTSTKISWKREAEIVWPGLEVVVVSGGAATRRKQLEQKAHIYIMNWESVRGHSRLAPYGSVSLAKCQDHGGEDPKVTDKKCEVHPRELQDIEFNAVICDEAHRMKDPQAKQTRAVWAATGDADIRIALTGTPLANAPDDLWTVLHWISPEEWPSKTRFIDRMLDVSYNAFGTKTVIGVKAHMQEEFFKALDPRMRRMPKELVLSHLPPVMRERRDVEMSPKQKKAYNGLVDQMIAELDDGDMLITTSPLIRMIRLLQFASSYAEIEYIEKWDEKKQETVTEEKVHLINPSCKIDAFMEDLDDFGDDQIVVFAVSSKLIDMLSEKLEKKNISHGLITGRIDTDQRQQYMDDFQAGKLKLMLCTIQAGGTGITLTSARVAVFLQRSWSMIDNNQAEARIHRIGSEKHESVLLVDYVTAGTVEETVIEAVEQKTNRLEEILRDQQLLRQVLKGDA